MIKNLYFLLLLYSPPFIDSLTGYLILSGSLTDSGSASTPSQFLRLALILFSIYFIKKNKKVFNYNMLFLVYILLIEVVSAFNHQSLSGFIVGVAWTSKIALLTLSFSSLYVLLLSNKITFISLLWHIRNNIIISSILLLVTTYFSLGFSTYIEGTFGSKGLFASGNGLSVYLGTGLLLTSYYCSIKHDTKSYILSLLVLTATLLVGTKSALIFSILGLITLMLFSKNRVFSLIFALFILIALVMFQNDLLAMFFKMFDVITLRFENNDSLSSYIYSGRDVKLDAALSTFNTDGFNIIRILTGYGTFVSFQDISLSNLEFITLESDFFDIFFVYGIFGIILYFCIYFYLAFKSRKDLFLLFIMTIWFSHSIFAGHSLFNGMSGILLPLIAILVLLKSKRNNMPPPHPEYRDKTNV